MTKFKGFPPEQRNTVTLHAQFISEVVPMIDDLAELKVCLFCYYALLQKQGDYRYLTRDDFANSAEFMQGLEGIAEDVHAMLDMALAKAVEHGFLLCADVAIEKSTQRLYFVNTAKGRTAIQQIEDGLWKMDNERHIEILPERPNIFTLYEENIGALTPAIAERLKDAESDYAYDWIVEAIDLAIENNVRRWNYISAILERWKQEGRVDEQTKTTQRNSSTNGKYGGLNWADFSE